MKMLVLHLAGVGIDRLLNDEELAALRQLAAGSCFGSLAPAAPGDDLPDEALFAQTAAAGGRAVALDRDDDLALGMLAAGDWDCLRCDVGPLIAEEALGDAVDRRIGRILERLDDQTAVLVLLGPAPGGFDGFILAAPRYPALSELRNVTLPDLGRTLLDLAGHAVPENLPGQSLVAGLAPVTADGLSDDEEALLRARLAGLGYI